MSVKFLIDEDVNSKIVKALQHENFELILVSENFSGISDKKILDIAKKLNLILITEDGDFGKLIFFDKEESIGIIYLKYKHQDLQTIIDKLITTIREHGEKLYKKFTVITTKKVRIQRLR